MEKLITQLFRLLRKLPFWLALIAVLCVFYDFGYDQSGSIQERLETVYIATLLAGISSTLIRYLQKTERPAKRLLFFDGISNLFFVLILIDSFHFSALATYLEGYETEWWNYSAIFLVFIREFSAMKVSMNRTYVNPAQIFILSFFGIIFLGSCLLLLPNATENGISFTNALFTSTSAVCVTGLIVVDTGTYFTFFGQCIILVLIQIGGLGIMTFASYFSYFFRGSTSSYENQLIMSDMTSSNKLGEVFQTLKKIILITFLIEAVGAIIIYSNLENQSFTSLFDQTFFSIFHSVSAFCNAGFSTLTDGLYDTSFRFNYGVQGIILALFIFGGLGFPIVFNLLNYLVYLFKKRLIPFLTGTKKENIVTPWVINLSTRITLITTLTLLVVGTLIFFFFEYNNTLEEHSGIGKFITAAFSAATPRTAGFNTVDTSSLRFSTTMLIFLLMWIGASPASTGGGIKTSTFAIATLNFWSLARGKERIEIFRREISNLTIRRAFAIISLSLVVIGAGTFLIASFDSDKTLMSIAFECFSAYSTVGLSLGITAKLSEASKFVLILMMFIGRVSMLSILIAIVKKEKFKNYKYSREEILIN